jgi:hypothetical protein
MTIVLLTKKKAPNLLTLKENKKTKLNKEKLEKEKSKINKKNEARPDRRY